MKLNQVFLPFFLSLLFLQLYIYSNNHLKLILLFLIRQYLIPHEILNHLFLHTYPLQQNPLYFPNCLHHRLVSSIPYHGLFHYDDLMDELHLLLSFLAFFKDQIYKELFLLLTWLFLIMFQRTFFWGKKKLE